MTVGRLEKDSRVVTWTETRKVKVGYHNCDNCGRESPEPTGADLLAFAQNHGNDYLWPGTDGWCPPGWSSLLMGDAEPVQLCDRCTHATLAALKGCRK